MNKQPNQESLEQVLDAYVAASPEPSREELKKWIQKYPNFTQELISFTVSWIQMEVLPSQIRNDLDQEALNLHAMSAVQNLIFQRNKAHETIEQADKEIQNLLSECSKIGFSIKQFAIDQFISVAILRKLDLRLISYESIPVTLLESLANQLQCTLTNIACYLQGAQLKPVGARQKSKQGLITSTKRNFFDEIRNDLTLDEEFRHYWINLEPTEEQRKNG
jgi:hypothetical protein